MGEKGQVLATDVVYLQLGSNKVLHYQYITSHNLLFKSYYLEENIRFSLLSRTVVCFFHILI